MSLLFDHGGPIRQQEGRMTVLFDHGRGFLRKFSPLLPLGLGCLPRGFERLSTEPSTV